MQKEFSSKDLSKLLGTTHLISDPIVEVEDCGLSAVYDCETELPKEESKYLISLFSSRIFSEVLTLLNDSCPWEVRDETFRICAKLRRPLTVNESYALHADLDDLPTKKWEKRLLTISLNFTDIEPAVIDDEINFTCREHLVITVEIKCRSLPH